MRKQGTDGHDDHLRRDADVPQDGGPGSVSGRQAGEPVEHAELYALHALPEDEERRIESALADAEPKIRADFESRVRTAREALARAFVPGEDPPDRLFAVISSRLGHQAAKPAAGHGKVYQMWRLPADGSAPVSEGTMSAQDVAGTKRTMLADIAPYTAVAVSVEPEGGSMAPTPPLVLELPFPA